MSGVSFLLKLMFCLDLTHGENTRQAEMESPGRSLRDLSAPFVMSHRGAVHMLYALYFSTHALKKKRKKQSKEEK